MTQLTHSEKYEKAKIFQDLIVPKLYAMQNNGDGATVHKTSEMICKIKNERTLYELALKNGKEDDILLYHAVVYYEYIRTAEIWMIGIAKKI
jgi:hypothetical protein